MLNLIKSLFFLSFFSYGYKMHFYFSKRENDHDVSKGRGNEKDLLS